MASRNLQKLSLMWSRRFLSRALWWARLSLETLPSWLKKAGINGLGQFKEYHCKIASKFNFNLNFEILIIEFTGHININTLYCK
jgi:hypothetical protein